jgi:isopropylmalate/homocitrate/citramalate synthase
MNALRSEYNTLPEVVGELEFPPQIAFIDSTIRSLQMGVAGSRHTTRDLVDIGKAISALGVRELILHLGWKGGVQACEGLAAAGVEAKVVAVYLTGDPDWRKWVDLAAHSGANELNVASLTDPDLIRRVADSAREKGMTISYTFGIGEFTHDEVIRLCRLLTEHEFQSIAFHDTFFRFGLHPEAAKHFFRAVKRATPECPPLYIHLSDFYGHATMTSIAALAAGATGVDTAINGVGHHVGHVPLAEVVIALEVLYGIDTRIKLDSLRQVSLLVRERTGIPVPIWTPVVGDFVFVKDGLYWAAEADLPSERRQVSGFPFSPSFVGSDEHIIWSDKTATKASIEKKLSMMGLRCGPDAVDKIVERLEDRLRRVTTFPNWLLDAEFEELCREVLTQSSASAR